MAGAMDQGGVTGGVWPTQGGMASPQQGRPALSGGLQQMQMLNALRSGASFGQLQQMNPYTPRPAQFLPPAMPQHDYMGQFRQQQAAQAAQQQALLKPTHYAEYGTEGGDPAGGVDGIGATGIGTGMGIDASAADAVNGHDAASDGGGGAGNK